MSADLSGEITAIATAVLAVFAILTTIYAVRAFRKQSQEVSHQASMLKVQSEQLAEQRKVNAEQIRVLALQAADLRYPDGGGLSAAGRVRREEVRLQAAEWFAEGVTPPEVARRLRVSSNSAFVWRRRWRAGGEAALASRGPGGAVCRLGVVQLARLRAALEAGPAAWGWGEDLRWTLARVTALIGRLFRRVSVAGLVCLKPGAGVTCSTGCASTAGARASAARYPKPITPA